MRGGTQRTLAPWIGGDPAPKWNAFSQCSRRLPPRRKNTLVTTDVARHGQRLGQAQRSVRTDIVDHLALVIPGALFAIDALVLVIHTVVQHAGEGSGFEESNR